MPVLDPAGLANERSTAIAEYHQRSGLSRAELDISGGVDSALILGLLCRAIGPENVTAVYSSIHSSEQSRQLARAAAAAFAVSLVELDLSDCFDRIVSEIKRGLGAAGYSEQQIEVDIQKHPVILGSLRSCLRAPIGRGINRMTRGGIRHGTGNECEDRFIRFYQKGGDGEVDTNPINMLSKGEVYQLALQVGVPQSIVEVLPTPDLHANGLAHNDEDELFEISGIAWTYSRIDPKSGEYLRLGTIEAMSRFLDRPGVQARVFGPKPLGATVRGELIKLAAKHEFSTLQATPERIGAYLDSARRMEAISRHKLNPAATGLGTRADLLVRSLVDDAVPRNKLFAPETRPSVAQD